MSDQAAPPIQPGKPPPKALLKMANPVIGWLAGSPLHGAAKGYMALTFTGRKTGRTITTPIGYRMMDGVITGFTGAPWRSNLHGGAPVEVSLEGRHFKARAETIEDPDEVARHFQRVLEQDGRGRMVQRREALKFSGDRMPTLEEIKEAVRGRWLIRIHPD